MLDFLGYPLHFTSTGGLNVTKYVVSKYVYISQHSTGVGPPLVCMYVRTCVRVYVCTCVRVRVDIFLDNIQYPFCGTSDQFQYSRIYHSFLSSLYITGPRRHWYFPHFTANVKCLSAIRFILPYLLTKQSTARMRSTLLSNKRFGSC